MQSNLSPWSVSQILRPDVNTFNFVILSSISASMFLVDVTVTMEGENVLIPSARNAGGQNLWQHRFGTCALIQRTAHSVVRNTQDEGTYQLHRPFASEPPAGHCDSANVVQPRHTVIFKGLLSLAHLDLLHKGHRHRRTASLLRARRRTASLHHIVSRPQQRE